MLMLVSQILAWSCSRPVPQDSIRKLEPFLKELAAKRLEEDYRSHNIQIRAVVTGMHIDGLKKQETAQDNVYAVRGMVSYRIEGKRTWRDREGNIIRLGPEQEITHWFTCGVLEDRYLGRLFEDDKNRLALFAEKPEF